MALNDVQCVPLKCHVDDRGFLSQIFGDYTDLFPEVKRIYLVGNYKRDTIRAFHKHEHETKAYFAASGAAKFVVASEDGTTRSYVLSVRSASVLIVPPPLAHGWISLDDDTVLVGLSDRTLAESLHDDVRLDPYMFGQDPWEVKAR